MSDSFTSSKKEHSECDCGFTKKTSGHPRSVTALRDVKDDTKTTSRSIRSRTY